MLTEYAITRAAFMQCSFTQFSPSGIEAVCAHGSHVRIFKIHYPATSAHGGGRNVAAGASP
jgi:hypothetical protein